MTLTTDIRTKTMRLKVSAEYCENAPLCSPCHGSGEGMYDGTTCYWCMGTGVDGYRREYKALQEEYEDYLYDQWKGEAVV